MIPSIVRATFVGAAYMGTYDSSKHWLINNDVMEDGFNCQLVATIIAGFNMTVVSSPADNAKTRMMN